MKDFFTKLTEIIREAEKAFEAGVFLLFKMTAGLSLIATVVIWEVRHYKETDKSFSPAAMERATQVITNPKVSGQPDAPVGAKPQIISLPASLTSEWFANSNVYVIVIHVPAVSNPSKPEIVSNPPANMGTNTFGGMPVLITTFADAP